MEERADAPVEDVTDDETGVDDSGTTGTVEDLGIVDDTVVDVNDVDFGIGVVETTCCND